MGRSASAYSKAAVAAHVLAKLLATDRGEQKWRRSSDEIFKFIENQGIIVTPYPYSPPSQFRKELTFASALNGLNKGFCFGPPPMVLYRSDLDEASRKLVGLHEYFHLLNPNCRSTDNATSQTIMAKLAQGLVPESWSQESFRKGHDIEGPCNLFARCTLMPEPIFSETLKEQMIWNAALMYDLPMAEIALRATDIFQKNFAAVAFHYKRGVRYSDVIATGNLEFHIKKILEIVSESKPPQVMFGSNALENGDIDWTEFVNVLNNDVAVTYFNDMQNERLIIVVADASMPIAHSSRARDYSIFDKLEPYITLPPTTIEEGFNPATPSSETVSEHLAVQIPWEEIGEFLKAPQMTPMDSVLDSFESTGTGDFAPDYFAVTYTGGNSRQGGIIPKSTPDPNQFSLNLPVT